MYLLVSGILPSLFLFDMYTKTSPHFRFWQITVRALGCESGQEGMKRIVSEVSDESSGQLTFTSFLKVMTHSENGMQAQLVTKSEIPHA